MNDLELKNTWNLLNSKIEANHGMNLLLFENLQLTKVKSKLYKFKLRKAGSLLLVLICIFVALKIANTFTLGLNTIFIVFSFISLAIIYAIVLFNNAKQIGLLNEIDKSENLLDVQSKIALIQSKSIQTARILCLQMPFYCTFSWNMDWIKNDTTKFMLIVVPITLLFSYFSIWLFKNLDVKNKDKWWFRLMLNDEIASTLASAKYLDEIEKFKNESSK